MSSSRTRVDRAGCFGETWEGGVRPAPRCAAWGRSRRPSCEHSGEAASVAGSAFFPEAVRAFGPRDLGVAAFGLVDGGSGFTFAESWPPTPLLPVFLPFAPVRAMAGN